MKSLSMVSFILSIVALILAAVVSVFGMNLWLAGTQWILVAIIFAAYAIYLKECCAPKQ